MKPSDRYFRMTSTEIAMVILITPITDDRWLVETYEDGPMITGMDADDIRERYPLTESLAEQAGGFLRK